MKVPALTAAFEAARAKTLPDQSMRQTIAEAQAKNASEAQVTAAAGKKP